MIGSRYLSLSALRQLHFTKLSVVCVFFTSGDLCSATGMKPTTLTNRLVMPMAYPEFQFLTGYLCMCMC